MSYGAPRGASRLVGRMVLDTAVAHSRIDPSGFRLRFVEGYGPTGVLPGAARGAAVPGDSLSVTLVGRDNHTRFGFPRLGASTFGLGSVLWFQQRHGVDRSGVGDRRTT